MNQVTIIIHMSDGSITVYTFLTVGRSPTLPSGAVWLDDGYWYREPSDDNIQAEINKTFLSKDDQGRPTHPFTPVSWVRDKVENLPKDWSFRGAWTYDGGKFGHDMVKAREIHMGRLRKQREPLLEKLDRDWMRASGQKKAAEADDIEARRQALRDAPDTLAPAIEAASTVEELKLIGLPE